MKKLFTLLFSAGLVTAAFAQTGGHYRNDSRSNNNSYQSWPQSNGYQNGYPGQYSNTDPYNRNSQWNGRGYDDRYSRSRERMERERIARERYEYEMMMRRRQQWENQRRYNSYGRRPVLQIQIGGGRRY